MAIELVCYKQIPVWDESALPEHLVTRHNTQAGTWGGIKVLKGRLKFHELNDNGEVVSEEELTPESDEKIVHPQEWHKVAAASDDMQMQFSCYCEKADYFHKRYGMTTTHSDVVAAAEVVKPCKVLDLGCGQGRNALYLSLLDFDVTAVDQNPGAVQALGDVASQEHLPVRTGVYDINRADLPENFDFIVATVVFMFLQPDRVPEILADIQAKTNPGGYNLIVSAMDTADFPCPMPFSFKFKEGELRDYYRDWEMVEYSEELGAMHATDELGNPIQFKFVNMLARKPL